MKKQIEIKVMRKIKIKKPRAFVRLSLNHNRLPSF